MSRRCRDPFSPSRRAVLATMVVGFSFAPPGFAARFSGWSDPPGGRIERLSGDGRHADMTDTDSDVNALVDFLLPFAERMLRKSGDFFPFGATIDKGGDVRAAMVADGEESRQAVELIRSMREAFRNGAAAGNHRATALAYDILKILPATGKKSDAVAIDFDHSDGTSIVIIFPYTALKGSVSFGEYFIEDGLGEIFPRP